MSSRALPRPSLGSSRRSIKPTANGVGLNNNGGGGGNGEQLIDGFASMNLNSRSVGGSERLSINHRQSSVNNGRALGSLSRRSSAYAPRNSSYGQPGLGKDPRPIRDKKWQAQAIRSIIQFLVNARYSQSTISPKTLSPPSAKDFRTIFKFIYSLIDPNHSYHKSFEEEFQMILRGLRYPYADTIKDSTLKNVGAMHAWPALLAALTWMVELIVSCDQLDNPDEFSDPNDPSHAEKIFFEYLERTYVSFLEGADDFKELDDELVRALDQKSELVVFAVNQLSKAHENLLKEQAALNATEAPLVLAEKENVLVGEDIKKFKQYIKGYLEPKKQKFIEIINEQKEDLAAKEKERETRTEEKEKLATIVDSQEISPADVDRMNAERDQLSAMLKHLDMKQEEGNKAVWEKEMLVQKRMDKLEKAVKNFNDLTFVLGLQDPGCPETNGTPFEIVVKFNSTKPDGMTNLNFKTLVKPTLARMRTKTKSDTHKLKEECIFELQEEHECLQEALAEKMEEIEEMSAKVIKFNKEYVEAKENAGVTISAQNKDKENLEREIQKLRISNGARLVESHQSVSQKEIEYDQMVRKYQEIRKFAVERHYKAMEDFVHFTSHVSDSLAEIRGLAVKEFVEAGGQLQEAEGEE